MDDASEIWLLLSFAVGIGAWLLGRRAGRHERPPLSRDYQQGLQHLLNDRVDDAVRVLGDVATRDDDALELQFVLGTLFRKRGEVDRATGLHKRLAAHRSPEVERRARYELALDFVAAGLLDRAEQQLLPLAADGRYRDAAQLQLLRLYEIQSDWLGALKLHKCLTPSLQVQRATVAAHYLCELADQALLTGECARAGTLLDEAVRYDAGNPRIEFLRARCAEKAGSSVAAREHYDLACAARPALRAALNDAGAQFRCLECGFDSSLWHWRCPRCHLWDRCENRD
jgi:lipopolysaccharide biosynthesis regulator YciM